MDIGPNLTSVLLQLITLAMAVVAGVFSYLGNRKAKALDVKVVAVDAKVMAVADGINAEKQAALLAQKIAEKATEKGVGKAEQVAEERAGERERSAARVQQASDVGRKLGQAEGAAEERRNPSGFTPLDSP